MFNSFFGPSMGPYNRRYASNNRRNTGNPFMGGMPPLSQYTPPYRGPVPPWDSSVGRKFRQNQMPPASRNTQEKASGGAPEVSGDGAMEVKFSSNGDITLPNHTKQGDTYNISAINLDTASHRLFRVKLDFSCNVCITDASLHLRFQIFKQGAGLMAPLPVGPGYHFSRKVNGTESNTIAFSAHDLDTGRGIQCSYSVYVKVMGDEIDGTAMITNSVLIAALTEP